MRKGEHMGKPKGQAVMMWSLGKGSRGAACTVVT